MNNKVEIYGFSGKLGTGKNYVAEKIFLKMLPEKPTLVLAFADTLKLEGIVRDGLERSKVFGEKDEYTRKKLQTRGTEEGRDKYGERIWVNFMEEIIHMHASRGIQRFIISDVRFENEFELVKQLGGLNFRVEAPKRNLARLEREAKTSGVPIETIASHKSETLLDNYLGFDYIIKNDYEDNAFNRVRDIVHEINAKNTEELVVFCDVDDTICHCHSYYEEVIDKVKNIIKENINIPMSDSSFTSLFDLFFNQVNQYYKEAFKREKFAESLSEVVGKFSSVFKDQSRVEGAIKEAYDLGISVFSYNYEPITGAVESIKELSKLTKVVLFTMGDRVEQAKKIAYLGLSDFQYEIHDMKDETLFRALKNKYKAKEYVMIGDSYTRDIVPAVKTNIDTVIHIKLEESREPSSFNTGEYIEANSLFAAVNVIKEIYSLKTLKSNGQAVYSI